jgi:hypothetical protein
MKYFKAKYILIFFLLIQGCKSEKKNYFPSDLDIKWMYSINIHSSYKNERFLKRIMITNVKKDKKNNKVELSKLYSDGSYYTYEIDENKKTVFRKSVVLAFNEGIVEPVQKIVYPDLTFKTNGWETSEQLFLVKGFQPPLRNFKPRSKFKMNYKVTRRNFKFKSRNRSFNDCVEIEGKGNASFIADTRSGPIIVDVINNEVLCNNIGLVYQKRSELTNASAFGNMELKKYLINQED